MNILLVEDDQSIRLLMANKLTEYGYDVSAVATAEAAWELWQQDAYPLVILDWLLPGMSGLELCKKIRTQPLGKYTYLWVVTARNAPQDVIAVLQAGANDYLNKPLDLQYLKVRAMIAEEQAQILLKQRLAEEALQSAYAELEAQVEARTQELSNTVRALRSEVQERQRAEQLVTESKDQLRALSAHLMSIQEEQQKRISRELHDELGQAMTAIKIDLNWIRSQLSSEQSEIQSKIQALIPLVSDTITTVQRICAELRPGILDDLGLVAALEWLTQEFEKRTQIHCRLDILPEELRVPTEISLPIYRICQEALTNVMRHADAERVSIFMQQKTDEIYLEIRDNGRGISDAEQSASSSLGLMGMRERVMPWNGRVEIDGVAGKGTEIRVHIPHLQEMS